MMSNSQKTLQNQIFQASRISERTIKNFQGNLIALSTDGKTFATYQNSLIKIWHLNTSLFDLEETLTKDSRIDLENIGQSCHYLKHTSDSIALSPNGEKIASGGRREHNGFLVKLGNSNHDQLESTPLEHQQNVYSVTFNHNGTVIASGSYGIVKIWDSANNKSYICNYPENEKIWIHAVAFSPDGKRLASSSGGKIYFWDWNNGKLINEDTITTPARRIYALTFAPVSNQIICAAEYGDKDQRIIMVNLEKKQISLPLVPVSRKICCLVFSGDGQNLISINSEGTLTQYKVTTSEERSDKIANLSDSLSLKPSEVSKELGLSRPNPVGYAVRIREKTDEKCTKELTDLLQARFPLVFLRSTEESRAINCVMDAYKAITSSQKIKPGELVKWSSIKGFEAYSKEANQPNRCYWTPKKSDSKEFLQDKSLLQPLRFLREQVLELAREKNDNQYTYLLPDWSILIKSNDDIIIRQLKELAILIEELTSQPRVTLIIIAAEWSIPPLLRNYIHVVDLALPKGEELYESIFKSKPLEEKEARLLSEQAQGMGLQIVEQTSELITAKDLWKDIEEAKKLLVDIKKQEIHKTGVLEYYPSPLAGGKLDDVIGGLDLLKDWIRQRQKWLLQNTFVQLRPRAILLEGFPGCGKSLIAKAIAQEWGVPQINFEISRLRSKFVGESESLTNQALRAIEASAPNILFMDEIEKAFSGIGTDSTGVTTRQFGIFLSWLNDHSYPIFFIATSNNTENLPPELLRPGRFDEIFIILPPNTQERREIIQKRAIAHQLEPIEETILSYLVENTKGFSGAELDKLVQQAIYLHYLPEKDKQQVPERLEPPTKEEWTKALKEIKPQYNSQRMRKLLQKYKQKIDQQEGKKASSEDKDFWDFLFPQEEKK